MPRPKIRRPTEDRARTKRAKAAEVKVKRTLNPKRLLPDKVGKVKHIYSKKGNLLMVGTEAEWRKWVKTRPTRG